MAGCVCVCVSWFETILQTFDVSTVLNLNCVAMWEQHSVK
jgi:hypothetical protein